MSNISAGIMPESHPSRPSRRICRKDKNEREREKRVRNKKKERKKNTEPSQRNLCWKRTQ
jgi:hypothetical protein